MSEAFFASKYPGGKVTSINPDQFQSLNDLFEQYLTRFEDKPAFSCLGQELSFAELNQKSAQFADYLQNHTDLQQGDRVAIQLPNILQYPVVMLGILRAGMVVVNTNPLYTEREMEHQFNDSGAKALVVLANMADKAEAVLPKTSIKHVIVTEVGDMHGLVKRNLINNVLKYVKKEVPAFNLPQALSLRKTLQLGGAGKFTTPELTPEDVAVLQYTGGTTGVAKGAMLTHRNLLANTLQCQVLFAMKLEEGQERLIAPLPLYHIYAFIVHCMVMLDTGNCSVLIPNPRDIKGFIKTLEKEKFTGFVGLNTLFVALSNQQAFRDIDFSRLKMTVSGGMALTKDAADQWKKVTGCEVTEGYGMTESSPVVSFNPPDYAQLGSIGLPVPNTDCKVVDDDGVELGFDQAGELLVKGPQVMKGYWQRPEATAETITEDGWLKTGDMAVIQQDGYMKIVDRKKDMIIVSGFNVYPNEIEEVLVTHPAIVEAAAIGVPDAKTSEAVKVFIVSNDENLTVEDVIKHAREDLTAYKIPRHVVFKDELPKTNVGKVLRRELRDNDVA